MKKPQNINVMNRIKKIAEVYPITIPSIVVCLLLCIVMLFYNVYFAFAGFLLIIIFGIVGVLINNISAKKLEFSISELNKKLSADEKYGELQFFPLPVVIFDNTDKILWYNQLFSNAFISVSEFENVDVKQFTSGQGITTIRENHNIECEFADKKYTAFSSVIDYKDETAYIL